MAIFPIFIRPFGHFTIMLIIAIGLLLTLPILGSAYQQKIECPTVDWSVIKPNIWTSLTTCGEPAPKVFHGASALATDRGIIFFFGADTHETNYDNSVYRLGLTDLRWNRDYEADSIDTYQITRKGYPTTSTNHPWAMHTFDGWDYDPIDRTLVLVGSSKHATRAIQKLQKQGKLNASTKPVTWKYDPDRRSWTLIDTATPDLFAGGFSWDPLANRFVGHNGQHTFHYDPQHHEWLTFEAPSTPGYHLRLVYDTFAQAFLALGNNHNSPHLWRYSSKSIIWNKVLVPQPPLPANGAAMAYDSQHQVLLYLANDSPQPYENPSSKSVTFLYQSKTQAWRRLTIPSPPLFGMNFLMQYDPDRDVFLHFEKASIEDNQINLWVFQYQP